MRILWFAQAWEDLDRLNAFIADRDPDAADAILDKLVQAPEALLNFPRRGARLSRYAPREVREFRVANYLLRYEVEGDHIFVLRLFHFRQDRPGRE